MITVADALITMEREPGRSWTPSEMSAALGTLPEIGRRLLRKLLDEGRATLDVASGRYRLCDMHEEVRRFLAANPGQEFTAIGIAEALPDLNLSEEQAMRLLQRLELSGQCIAFYSHYQEVQA